MELKLLSDLRSCILGALIIEMLLVHAVLWQLRSSTAYRGACLKSTPSSSSCSTSSSLVSVLPKLQGWSIISGIYSKVPGDASLAADAKGNTAGKLDVKA